METNGLLPICDRSDWVKGIQGISCPDIKEKIKKITETLRYKKGTIFSLITKSPGSEKSGFKFFLNILLF
jgi:hypothetical protein